MQRLSPMLCFPAFTGINSRSAQKKAATEAPHPRAHQENSAVVLSLLNESDREALLQAAGKLGPDPTSKTFATRAKSIGFVICFHGKWFQISQDFFNQASDYNNASGGYRRYYRQLPLDFIESPVSQRLLNNFKSLYDIPDGQLVLLQVQTSQITEENEGKCLTGQGIHSDGADKAMLVILKRSNVVGARSSVYTDVNGLAPIVSPTALQEGEVLFWKDNEVYHYVEPAALSEKSKIGERTVLIAHYPAMHYITGRSNPNNTLPPSGKHPPHIEHSDLV